MKHDMTALNAGKVIYGNNQWLQYVSTDVEREVDE